MEEREDVFEEWNNEFNNRPWIVRKFNYIKYWWKHTGRYMHIMLKYSIGNLWIWFPIIWKDRNHDYTNILTILRFKLINTAKLLKKNNRFVSTERKVEVINTCVRLIDLVKEEFYDMESMSYHESKYWFEPTDDGNFSYFKSKIVTENFDEYFKKYPLVYKQVIKEHPSLKDDKHHLAIQMGKINHNRARKLLFKIMEENIETWWD